MVKFEGGLGGIVIGGLIRLPEYCEAPIFLFIIGESGCSEKYGKGIFPLKFNLGSTPQKLPPLSTQPVLPSEELNVETL
jgi:hypothetical protein